MYCPHCGAEKKEGANFCANCGKPLTEGPPAVSASPPEGRETPPAPPAAAAPQAPPTKLIIILVIVGIIFIGGAVFGLVILPKITKKAAQTGKAISETVEKAAEEAKALSMSEEDIRVAITQLGSAATRQQAKEKLILNREAAKPLLVQASGNPNYYIRWGAVETLRDAGYAVDYVPAYIADLRSSQSHNNRDLRKNAAKWLGPAKDPRAIGPLKWAGKNDEYRGVRNQAEDSLEKYYGIKVD